ncbi:MAG: hypothetical protein MJ212_05780 [Alphaproteobacteria bacterium]|nr:hypothetical protein [Alphaproteobacteria bacterium]
MKLWSKEALVLGGIYSVLSTPFVYSNNAVIEQISSILLIVFIICAIMLCFNKTPKFISFTLNKYPKISYYLAAFGWIPYFVMIAGVSLFISAYFIKYDENNIEWWLKIMHYVLEFGIPISLVIAFIRQKIGTKKIARRLLDVARQ